MNDFPASATLVRPVTPQPPADPDGLPLPRRYRAIGSLCFGSALIVIDGGIATVALPTLARDLHVADSAAVLVVTVYQLTLVMGLLPFSALGDRIGHRTLYQRGQMLFLVASLLCFFARSLPFLLVCRVAQAIGAAMALSVAAALLRSTYPARHLGSGLSVNAVIIASMGALAPTIGGYVLSVAPWPWVFAAGIPLGIVSLLLGRALPDPERRDIPYDTLAAVLCALTFGLVIGGLEGVVHGDSPMVAAAIIAAGGVIGWIFVQRELGAAQPGMPVDLLRRMPIALSAGGSIFAFVAATCCLLSLPFRLQHIGNFPPATIGTMMGFWPLTMLFTSPLVGFLSDRVPAGILGAIGMAIATTGLLLVAWLPADPDFVSIAWRMVMCGTGFGLFTSPNARLILGSAPRERAAAAGGLVATTRMTGQTLGATLLALLLALGVGSDATPAFVAAGLTIGAFFLSIFRLRPTLHNPPRDDVPDL